MAIRSGFIPSAVRIPTSATLRKYTAHLTAKFQTAASTPPGKAGADIFLLPVSMKQTAVILEIKAADTFTGMEKECIEALKQITAKKYDQELRQTGYCNILKYGVAFYRKDCMIRC